MTLTALDDVTRRLRDWAADVLPDLPPLVEAARVRHAQMTICLHAAIGEQAAVTEAMASAALALAARGE